MSLINKEVNDFEVKAFQNYEFKTVKKEDILGKWSVFFFYPADFTFVCPTELEDLSNKYEEFKKLIKKKKCGDKLTEEEEEKLKCYFKELK